MQYILTPEQMRALDARLINAAGIPGVVLMEHAASGVVQAVLEQLPENGDVLILCGGGNNGGDGLAVLRQLAMRHVRARALLLSPPERLAGDALLQYRMAVGCSLCMQTVLTEEEAKTADISADILVDALFGTGLSRVVEGRYRRIIERVNEANARIVAVDIPSGVDGETGHVLGAAIRADITVTFQHKKMGHLLFPGRSLAGEVRVAPIGIIEPPRDAALQYEEADIAALLPPREQNSHKGTYGRALLCGGCAPYAGAALLSAKSGLRAGCGLLHVAVPRGIRLLFAAFPDAICHPAGQNDEWTDAAAQDAAALLPSVDVAAIGPGMGKGEGIPDLLRAALLSGKPLVIDADGLNALCAHRELFALLHQNVILTPHPAEMGRLAGRDAKTIADSPVEAAQSAAREWGCTLLLKGATSVIAQDDRLCLNTTGNPGLAKGGSGDVLTGILLALLAQKIPPVEAACAGAYLLGATADQAYALLGTRMLTPSDVIEAFDR
ncbi:MAG: NAD(P)H-hydrate dehydratase [Bacillota bacterium]